MAVKVAVMLGAPLIVMVQVVAVPEHPPPLHPEKIDPALGVAVMVTVVPDEYRA